MNFDSKSGVYSSDAVCPSPQIALSQVKPTTKRKSRGAKSASVETNFGPHFTLEDAHTEVCQKTQGGYGYDVGLHWRILAAILYGIYTWFPLNTASRIFGRLSRVPLPRVLRGPVVRAYAWIFSARLEEAEFHNDLARYNSISHFFRRRLVPSARPVDPTASLVSPADGKVISCGKVEEGHLEQVKGLAYTLRALLGPHGRLERRHDLGAAKCLYHCAIYLAPGDYHCFHSPADWNIDMRRHFPGRLFSVCSLVTSWLNGVFCINERAVYMGNWRHGFFAFVAVGATNVGSIHVFADPDLVTNRQPSYLRHLFTSRRGVKVTSNASGPTSDPASASECGTMPPIKTIKGELFGEFNFGSTIVLIFEAPAGFQFFVKRAERVRVGQALGHVVSDS
ncbi:Phosphatidylserine decarboxylase proenzyme mitochondrial [Taenia solium]|eukprot:TsM_000010300 transcript=TsM_000010300 gene=TsM_000010300